MNLLNETISRISAVDHVKKNHVKQTLRACLPEAESLGTLAELLYHYAGIVGGDTLAVPKKCTVIACADHGVAEMKTSAYPVETTVQMTKNYLIAKGAVANALANFSGSEMMVVDMGIAAPMDNIEGLMNRKIALGTKNCAKQAAMTRSEAIQAIHTGIEIANIYAKQNYRCFLPGEMGIANTTSSAAIVAAICNLSPEQATGRGTNISDERLKLKIEVVRQTLSVNQPDPHDGIDVLAKVGGFELGCIVGIILGAAANRAFVVLDGFNTGAAALIASALCPAAKNYLMGSHLAAEPAHKQTLEKLDLHPYMDMKFRLGEATGSSIAVNLLDAVISAYQQITGENKPAPPKETVTVNIAAINQDMVLQYTQGIEPLADIAMEKCQFYVDNLTKPLHSLGALEDIAVKIAGVNRTAKPYWQKKTLVSFNAATSDLTNAFSLHAQASITVLNQLSACHDVLTALVYGIKAAETIAGRGNKIIGFAGSTSQSQTAAAENLSLLHNASPSDDFIALFAEHASPELAAMTGIIIGSARARATVVTDDFASQIAAYWAIKIAPAAKDYLLIPEYSPLPAHQSLKASIGLPAYLDLNVTIGSGCTSTLGMRLIDAAIHMVNDMKTFEDAAVATATDGPGSKRQIK